MKQRGISEVDLRTMVADAVGYRPSRQTGRWVVETAHGRQPWVVIVEPDRVRQLLVVVTAYPVD